MKNIWNLKRSWKRPEKKCFNQLSGAHSTQKLVKIHNRLYWSYTVWHFQSLPQLSFRKKILLCIVLIILSGKAHFSCVARKFLSTIHHYFSHPFFSLPNLSSILSFIEYDLSKKASQFCRIWCCIFWPASGCCAPRRLVQILFSLFFVYQDNLFVCFAHTGINP